MSTKKGGTKAHAPPIIELGYVIGEKYRVEAVIGSGGMGVVVAARHIAMNSRVAIKVLKLDDDVEPTEAIARFQREARAAARIQSEHVVRVTDVAALPDGTPYMVMEYLEGEDLRRVIQERHQLPIEEAVDYVLQACEGLAEAHAAGVIHRDLKPSNLFLARRGNGTTILKVLDFGISKVAPRADEVAMTTTNSLMGSPLYMAPEQMRSSRNVDARADVWSLGLILYELLTADLPFGGETIPEICIAVMGAEPEAISHFRQDVPQELQAVLLKCMAKKPDDRYSSTASLAHALTPFSSERARVHADRASAALKTDRAEMESLPSAQGATGSTSRKLKEAGGILVAAGPPEPATRPDPETQPSWSQKRDAQIARKRSTWVAVGALFIGVAATVGVLVARMSASTTGAQPAVVDASKSAAASGRTGEAPAPSTPNVEIASVPFDSLPVAPRDAGVALRPSRPSEPVHASAPPSAAPSASSNPHAKDDWKWGDRN